MTAVARMETWKSFLSQARVHERAGRIDAAWACLEAAHIVGQRSTILHVRSHWHMLQLALRIRGCAEMIGQIARLLAATVTTWLWVPIGNSGRSHMSVLASAPLPRDLKEIM